MKESLYEVNANLQDTDPSHSDYVDSVAYAIAAQEAKLKDEYILLHIQKKPIWMPMFVYKFLLKKLLHLTCFKIK